MMVIQIPIRQRDILKAEVWPLACVTDIDMDGYASQNPASGALPGNDCNDNISGAYPGNTSFTPGF